MEGIKIERERGEIVHWDRLRVSKKLEDEETKKMSVDDNFYFISSVSAC